MNVVKCIVFVLVICVLNNKILFFLPSSSSSSCFFFFVPRSIHFAVEINVILVLLLVSYPVYIA
jgi:hypothetical protein